MSKSTSHHSPLVQGLTSIFHESRQLVGGNVRTLSQNGYRWGLKDPLIDSLTVSSLAHYRDSSLASDRKVRHRQSGAIEGNARTLSQNGYTWGHRGPYWATVLVQEQEMNLPQYRRTNHWTRGHKLTSWN